MKNTVGAKVAIGVCALVMGFALWAQPGQPDAPAVLSGILLTPWFMNLVRLPLRPPRRPHNERQGTHAQTT